MAQSKWAITNGYMTSSGLNSTTYQISRMNMKFFDTVEREDYANFLGKTITGMYYPYNGSNDEYVNEFFKRLRENSTEKGYKWVG